MGFEVFGTPSITTTVVGPVNAPASGRGVRVQLGKATGVQLNTAAATTIFTAPATGGFSRCIVTEIVVDNFSAVATTASVSYGQSATPTDWAATATMPGATGVTKFVQLLGGPAATGSAMITTPGTSFVANVTIVQGVATTCDISAWGFYE